MEHLESSSVFESVVHLLHPAHHSSASGRLDRQVLPRRDAEGEVAVRGAVDQNRRTADLDVRRTALSTDAGLAAAIGGPEALRAQHRIRRRIIEGSDSSAGVSRGAG